MGLVRLGPEFLSQKRRDVQGKKRENSQIYWNPVGHYDGTSVKVPTCHTESQTSPRPRRRTETERALSIAAVLRHYSNPRHRGSKSSPSDWTAESGNPPESPAPSRASVLEPLGATTWRQPAGYPYVVPAAVSSVVIRQWAVCSVQSNQHAVSCPFMYLVQNHKTHKASSDSSLQLRRISAGTTPVPPGHDP